LEWLLLLLESLAVIVVALGDVFDLGSCIEGGRFCKIASDVNWGKKPLDDFIFTLCMAFMAGT
jgi:hypothetical protein